jgi:hypothetical protein
VQVHAGYSLELLNDPASYKEIIRSEFEKIANCKINAWRFYSYEHMDRRLRAIDQHLYDLATPIFGAGWPIIFSTFPDRPADGDCHRAIRGWVGSIMLMYVTPPCALPVLHQSEELPWLDI